MALNASKVAGGGPKQEPTPIGSYPARLVQVISLGLQKQSYKGEEKKPAQEIFTTYELLDEFMKDEDGNDIKDKPRWISERFPLFNIGVDRAKSTKRYLALDPLMEHKGDWAELLGAPCMVTVVHNKKGEAVYSNIGNVSTMRPKEAEKAPDLINSPKVFDVDNPDLEVYQSLPDWIKSIIQEGLDFEGSPLDKALSGAPVNHTEHEEDEPQDEGEW